MWPENVVYCVKLNYAQPFVNREKILATSKLRNDLIGSQTECRMQRGYKHKGHIFRDNPIRIRQNG